MPHIHTEPNQHDHTVTGFIIRDDGDEPRAFLHMHKKLHMLLPVGGHIELDETPWGAIAHELEEESGYRLADVEIMQPTLRIKQYEDIVVHPQPLFMNTHAFSEDHWHSDTAYLFLTHSDPTQELGKNESLDIRWLTRREIEQLPKNMIYDNIRDIYLQAMTVYIDEWEPVSVTSFKIGK